MSIKEFFGKFSSRYLWGNLIAMLIVVILLFVGLKFGLNAYTRHGESIPVPNLYGMDYKEARTMLEQRELFVVISDSGYNKRMPAGCILTQLPAAGAGVKEGRTIYVTINSTSSPKVTLPDLIDNSSFREAQARLIAIGFKLLPPKYIDGERDWVYDIQLGTRSLQAGEQVSIESPLTLVVGSGSYDYDDDDELALDSLASSLGNDEEDIDDFEEVE